MCIMKFVPSSMFYGQLESLTDAKIAIAHGQMNKK